MSPTILNKFNLGDRIVVTGEGYKYTNCVGIVRGIRWNHNLEEYTYDVDFESGSSSYREGNLEFWCPRRPSAKVALICCGGQECYYRLYNTEVQPGDHVMVTGRYADRVLRVQNVLDARFVNPRITIHEQVIAVVQYEAGWVARQKDILEDIILRNVYNGEELCPELVADYRRYARRCR